MDLPPFAGIALTAFAVGQFLDFTLRKAQRPMWRFMRRTFWDRLERIKPRSLHRSSAEKIVEWFDLDQDDPPKGLIQGYAAFICLWGMFWSVALLGYGKKVGYGADDQSTLIAMFVTLLAVAAWAIYLLIWWILFVATAEWWIAPYDRWSNRWKTSDNGRRQRIARTLDQLARGVIWGTGAFFLCAPVIWIYSIWGLADYPVSSWAVLLNFMFDLGSFMVTVKLLEFGIRGGELRLFLCAVFDLGLAAVISFLSYAVFLFIYGIPGQHLDYPGTNMLLGMLMITNFIPTLLVLGWLLVLALLKLSQVIARDVLRLTIYWSTDPDDEARAAPFSTIGYFIAVVSLSYGGMDYLLTA